MGQLLFHKRHGCTFSNDMYVYLSDVWVDVDLRTDLKKNLKEIGLHAQNMLTILSSTWT